MQYIYFRWKKLGGDKDYQAPVVENKIKKEYMKND